MATYLCSRVAEFCIAENSDTARYSELETKKNLGYREVSLNYADNGVENDETSNDTAIRKSHHKSRKIASKNLDTSHKTSHNSRPWSSMANHVILM